MAPEPSSAKPSQHLPHGKRGAGRADGTSEGRASQEGRGLGTRAAPALNRNVSLTCLSACDLRKMEAVLAVFLPVFYRKE